MFDYTSSEESLGRLKEREEIVAFINRTYEQYESRWSMDTKDLLVYLINAIEQRGFGNRK
jgi:hypothetical protein